MGGCYSGLVYRPDLNLMEQTARGLLSGSISGCCRVDRDLLDDLDEITR